MATIKINREELIKTLSAKVKEMKADNKVHEAQVDKYQKAHADWEKKCIAFAVKNLSKGRVSVRNWSQNETNIDIYIPTNLMPEGPDWAKFVTTSCYGDYEVKELEQFIRMLEMASDNAITMSALKNVSQYL